jgi:hypothetical protein
MARHRLGDALDVLGERRRDVRLALARGAQLVDQIAASSASNFASVSATTDTTPI